MTNTRGDLRQLQLVQLEMLEEIDRICRKHDIKYSLFAGSALGAIRHKGFIPWDDDLDVIMMRSEYEKFLEIAKQEIGEEYYLQKEFSKDWPMQFSKLRKNNTAFIERYIPKMEGIHMGVYVDIFPCDNLANSKLFCNMQFLASKVVIAKALDKRGYQTDSKLKKIFMVITRALPWKLFYKYCTRKNDSMSDRVHVFLGAASKMEHSVFPRKYIEDTTDMEFEGRKYPVSAHYDELLTVLYGDYMTPTPPEERDVKVHGEIVDLDNSYEQYIDIQKNMEIRSYTRSIR